MAEVNPIVQRITEYVAEFKLLPRQHRSLRDRLSRLKTRIPAIGAATLQDRVRDLGLALDRIAAQWPGDNAIVDDALRQAEAMQSAGASIAGVAAVANATAVIQADITKTRGVESGVLAVERGVLTPAELQSAASFGASAVSGSTLALGGVAVALWAFMRKRGRR